MRTRPGARLALVLGVLLALLALWPASAGAHAPTFAVYSKVEGTTSGNRVVFAFALDKMPLVALLKRDAAAPDNASPADVGQYRAFLTKYLFDRFSVANAGAPCSHPPELSRLSWDETILRVIAVTTFTCDAPLAKLDIRSLVTHDMPYSHELVSDLKHGDVIVRHFYVADDTEAHIDLAALPASGVVEPWRPRIRGRISYVPEPGPGRDLNAYTYAELGVDPPPQAPAAPPLEKKSMSFASFVGQGILHIFTGFDHVLFLVTLLLVVRSWRHLAVVVTSFTAAHSLTLALATLGIVTIPGRIIEPLIALTVLVVAVDAIARPQAGARAAIAFGFGLIHGLGLSSALRDLGLEGRELVSGLLGFNLGVEIGQLAIVAPLFSLVVWLRARGPAYTRVRSAVCAVVAVVAVFWIVVRVRQAFAG
jgi:hypothetical protein